MPESVGFILREMTSESGGFFSTLDADSEGVEGKFYVWSRDEVIEILGEEEGRIFCSLYDITAQGNWEHANILNMPRDPETVANAAGRLDLAQPNQEVAETDSGLRIVGAEYYIDMLDAPVAPHPPRRFSMMDELDAPIAEAPAPSPAAN